jgi:hypothetical protein
LYSQCSISSSKNEQKTPKVLTGENRGNGEKTYAGTGTG